MKYVVVYGSQFGYEFNVGMINVYDDFDSAKRCCLANISEDFGCNSIEEFLEEYGLDYEKKEDFNPVYEIGRYDGDSHEEKYAVYEIKV